MMCLRMPGGIKENRKRRKERKEERATERQRWSGKDDASDGWSASLPAS